MGQPHLRDRLAQKPLDPCDPRMDQEEHPELLVPLTVLSTERLAHLELVIKNLKLVLDLKETLNSVEVMAEDVVDSEALVVLQEVDSKSWEYNGGLIIHIDVSS